MNEIVAISLPQDDNDIALLEELQETLEVYGYKYLDMNVQYETGAIIYRFQKTEEGPL